MKVLIPYDINTTGMKNPYLFLLMRELYKLDDIAEIQHGYGWLYEPGDWDVIHLHWPELLVKSQLPDMSRTALLEEHHFEKVLDAIRSKKNNGSVVILTVHNEKPHKDKTGYFENFYHEIYKLADGFIHMGDFSKKILEDYDPGVVKNKPAFIISHGDYRFFSSDLTRAECREKLNIESDVKLLLTFGAIRSKEELELGIDAFQKAGVKNGIYLMAGAIPNPYRSKPEHYIARKKLYRNMFNKRIRTDEKVIAPEDVQIYLKAADLVFLSRFNTLNSGNIALAFTFGKVVTGPGYGVIGEILNRTGNPVFDPVDLKSVSDAITKGFELAETGHGIKNKEYADHHMNWTQIAKETLQVYRSV